MVRGVLEAVATPAGPVLAGIALAVASPSAAFVVLAAVTVLSALPLFGITSDAPPPVPSSARRVTQDAVEGVRVVAAHRDLRLVFGLGFAQMLVRRANVFIVVVAFDLLRTDDSGVATLAVASALCRRLVRRGVAARREPPPRRLALPRPRPVGPAHRRDG